MEKTALVKRIIVFALIVVCFLVIDLIVKEFAVQNLSQGDLEVIPGFWSFHLTYNDDMGFSLLRFTDSFLDKDAKKVIIVILQFIGVGIAGVFFFSKGKFLTPWLKRLPLALICAGGLGNAIDRIIRGHVVDYIHWYVKGFSWPIFNLADTYSVVGIAILAVLILFFEKEKKKPLLTDQASESETTMEKKNADARAQGFETDAHPVDTDSHDEDKTDEGT